MEKAETLFKKDTIFFLEDKEEYLDEEVLVFVADELFRLGYAKESFKNALLMREKEFPTGLQMEPYAVAIPHADLGHVHKACIGVVRLRGSALFKDMIDSSTVVKVKFVFCIAIAEKQKQTDILQDLMKITGNAGVMEQLTNAQTRCEIFEILRKAEM